MRRPMQGSRLTVMRCWQRGPAGATGARCARTIPGWGKKLQAQGKNCLAAWIRDDPESRTHYAGLSPAARLRGLASDAFEMGRKEVLIRCNPLGQCDLQLGMPLKTLAIAAGAVFECPARGFGISEHFINETDIEINVRQCVVAPVGRKNCTRFLQIVDGFFIAGRQCNRGVQKARVLVMLAPLAFNNL